MEDPQTPGDVQTLARTKGDTGLADVVRRAFFSEGARLDEEIAARLGVTPSALSQLFSKDAAKLQPKTVKALIAKLQSRAFRAEVLRAWQECVFGEELQSNSTLCPEQVVKRADRLMGAMRPDEALALVREALSKERHEPEMRRALLDRAFKLEFWLDDLHSAFDTAQSLYSWGVESDDPERIASALALRARLMTLLSPPRPSDTASVYETIGDLVASYRQGPKSVFSASKKVVSRDYRLQLLKHAERSRNAAAVVPSLIRDFQLDVKATDSNISKSNAMRAEARAWLALGQVFKAEDVLDEAIYLGQSAGHTATYARYLQAMIADARGAEDEAEELLIGLSHQCDVERRLLLKRLTMQRLTLLRGRKFPPSHPV